MNSKGENIYHIAARLMSPHDIGMGKDKLRNGADFACKRISSLMFSILILGASSATLFMMFMLILLFETSINFIFGISPVFLAIINFAVFTSSIVAPDIIQFHEPFKTWFKLPEECNPPELEPLFEALKKGTWEAVTSKGDNIPEYLFSSNWRIFLVAGPSYKSKRMWVRHTLTKAYRDEILVRPLELTNISWTYSESNFTPSNDNSSVEDEVEIKNYFLWPLDKSLFENVIKNTPHLMSDDVEAIKIKFALRWFYKKFHENGSLSSQKWKYMVNEFAKDLKSHANDLRQKNSINNVDYNMLTRIGLTGKDDDKWLRDLRRGKYISICRKLEEAYKSLKIA